MNEVKEAVKAWKKEKAEAEAAAADLRARGKHALADAILEEVARNKPDFVVQGFYDPADDEEDEDN